MAVRYSLHMPASTPFLHSAEFKVSRHNIPNSKRHYIVRSHNDSAGMEGNDFFQFFIVIYNTS